ncbi:Clp family protein [Streptomyces sp. NBRC 110611]|uniref:VanZ family protein n=1 Tax=Streptomyces sp. NBRC 110611 TaxID=1621259 RepID=UPI0008356C30|nr:VanZ family protein [Streptomyces sp. NBRC 110611]GAU70217.1 Clp family protein [Streptomyces sp. NBRC 110611]
MPFFLIALTIGIAGGLITGAATRSLRTSRRVLLGLVWLWAAGVAGLTFGTRSGGGQAVNFALLDVGNPADIVDFLLNTALFLPGGILFAALGLRWYTAGLLGSLGSLAIETTQYLVHSGRTSDVNDLLSNTLGCLAGFALAAAVRHALGLPVRRGRRARRARYAA